MIALRPKPCRPVELQPRKVELLDVPVADCQSERNVVFGCFCWIVNKLLQYISSIFQLLLLMAAEEIVLLVKPLRRKHRT